MAFESLLRVRLRPSLADLHRLQRFHGPRMGCVYDVIISSRQIAMWPLWCELRGGLATTTRWQSLAEVCAEVVSEATTLHGGRRGRIRRGSTHRLEGPWQRVLVRDPDPGGGCGLPTAWCRTSCILQPVEDQAGHQTWLFLSGCRCYCHLLLECAGATLVKVQTKRTAHLAGQSKAKDRLPYRWYCAFPPWGQGR